MCVLLNTRAAYLKGGPWQLMRTINEVNNKEIKSFFSFSVRGLSANKLGRLLSKLFAASLLGGGGRLGMGMEMPEF